MPQKLPGWRIDPPVSLPSDNVAMPAATAAAEPPEDPPGTRSRSQGLLVVPKYEVSVDEPNANSSIFVLPRQMPPASSVLATQVAVNGLT